MAAGDIVQVVAWADYGEATITVSGSQGEPSTWATPTNGNTLIAIGLTDSGISSAPSGFTQRIGGGTDPYVYMWDKISGGSETSVACTFSSTYDNCLIVYEIEGTVSFDVAASIVNDTAVTSIASGSSGTLSGSTSLAIVAALTWNYGEDISFDSGYTDDIDYTITNEQLPYYASGSKALTGTTATSTTASWTNSVSAVIALGVWSVSSVVDDDAPLTILGGTSTFNSAGLSVGAGPDDLAASASFDTVTHGIGTGPQPVALDAFTGFPAAIGRATQDGQAALTILAGSATFPTVTPVAINGEIAPVTVLEIVNQFSPPIVQGEVNRFAQPSTTVLSVSFPTVTAIGQVEGTAVGTAAPLSVSFPTLSTTTTNNEDVPVTTATVNATFPFVEPAARDLSAYFNADVGLSVEIAFDDYPLIGSPAWYDITTDVRGFTISRGRKSELDEYKAGVATILIDNNRGDYDPASHASPYYPNVKPMRQLRIRAAYGGTTYTEFRGFIESWPMQVKGHVDEVVTLKAVDGFKILQGAKDSTPQSTENSGTRVGNLLDEAGWPSALRTIGSGAITVPAYTPDCGSVLQLIRTIKDSEGGQFYIAANGNATFRNRTYRSGLSSQGTFGDAIGEIPYHGITFAYDDAQIWNRIEVTIGGFPSYSSSTASQDLYGIRQLTVADIQLPNTTDGDDLADVYRDRYKDPLERIETITLKPEAEPATMWPHVLGRDLGEKILVRYRTNDGQTKALTSYIESIAHKVRVGQPWLTTWSLSQYE